MSLYISSKPSVFSRQLMSMLQAVWHVFFLFHPTIQPNTEALEDRKGCKKFHGVHLNQGWNLDGLIYVLWTGPSYSPTLKILDYPSKVTYWNPHWADPLFHQRQGSPQSPVRHEWINESRHEWIHVILWDFFLLCSSVLLTAFIPCP